MRSTRIIRMLFSLAVALMLVGITAPAQEVKEPPKQEMKAEATPKISGHHKKSTKAKKAHAKKKAVKKEAAEAKPAAK